MAPRVLVDMDAIVADLATDWYSLYNAKYPDDILTVERVTQWDVGKTAKHPSVYKLLLTPGLYRNLKPIPGAIEGLKAIQKMGYEVFLLTASISGPHILADKAMWVEEHLPFISPKNFFTGYKKSMVKADYFIDDSPRNIREYKAAWPDAKILTIQYPYNRDAAVLCEIAPPWNEPKKAWAMILAYFLARAEDQPWAKEPLLSLRELAQSLA